MKKISLILIFSILFSFIATSCSEGNAKENSISKSELIKNVKVFHPEKKNIPIVIETGITLKAEEDSEISPEVSGALIKWYVDKNDFIKKGAPIAKIDPVNYEIQKNQAEGQLKSLESQYSSVAKDYERIKRLVDKNAAPAQQLDSLEAQFESLQNQIKVAKENLELSQRMVRKTILRAPYTGIITDRKVSLGEFIAAGAKPIVTMVKNDVLEAEINISEMFYGKIDKESEVTFYIPTLDKEIKGTIKSISSNIDSMKQFNIIADVNNEKNEIPTGIYAVAHISSKTVERTILPSSAIKETGKNRGEIYTVDEHGLIKKVNVITSIVFEDGVEVKGNLPEIIIKDANSVVLGEKVETSL